MQQKYIFAILACCTFLLAACSKDKPCPALTPVITANGPVVAGESLSLSVSGVEREEVAMYNWRGPNNFISKEESPVIYNVSSEAAGRYTLDVVMESGCIYSVTSDSVIIDGPQAPACNLSPNTGELGNYMSFYSVSSGFSSASSSYFVAASSMNGSITLEFRVTNNRLAAGVYNIVQTYGGDFWPGDVRIDFRAQSSIWSPTLGSKVYVTVVNNKATVSFCNIDFYSSTWNIRTKGSVNIVEP